VDQNDIYKAAAFVEQLFAALPPKEMRGRTNCPLLTIAHRAQDILTKPGDLSDQEAERAGRDLLDLYRVATAFRTLYGTLAVDDKINQHPLAEEAKSLFSNQEVDLRTSAFNLFNAHLLTSKGGLSVNVLAQSKKPGTSTPDLEVPATCYGESKALQSHSNAHLSQAIRDKLDDACAQLASAQAQKQLPFAIIFVDIPARVLTSPDDASEPFKQAMSETLLKCSGFDFVALSVSGFTFSVDELGYRQDWTLIHNGDAGKTPSKQAIGYLSRIFDRLSIYRAGKLIQADWSKK
jgi:hypothetical protein